MGCKPTERCFETMPDREMAFEGFWMGRTEVTVAQFEVFVKATGYKTEAEEVNETYNWRNPGYEQAKDRPVVALAFKDAEAYAKWAGVDVPNYEEWEYAARAGSPRRYFWGPEFDRAYAWFRVNSGGTTHPVARASPTRSACTTSLETYGNGRAGPDGARLPAAASACREEVRGQPARRHSSPPGCIRRP